jgi:hypothetical protein
LEKIQNAGASQIMPEQGERQRFDKSAGSEVPGINHVTIGVAKFDPCDQQELWIFTNEECLTCRFGPTSFNILRWGICMTQMKIKQTTHGHSRHSYSYD